MTQPFDLRINGESVVIHAGRLITTADTGVDGFTAVITVDRIAQPRLYEAIKPYRYSPVQVFLENKLRFTGKLTKTTPTKSAAGTVYALEGFSNTFNFVDSHLAPPYEFSEMNLSQIGEQLGKQTATKVLSSAPETGKFDRVTARPGQSGFQFLAPLAKQRNRLITSTQNGDLLLWQANTNQKTVGTIEENSPGSLLQQEFTAEFDGRKRFRTHKVVSQTPAGSSEAVAIDKNIKEPRHKLTTANDQVKGGVQETAEWQKNIDLIKSLTQNIPIIGWDAPDGSRVKTNTMITIKSESIFIPDGFTFYIRGVTYILEGSTKTAVLSLIPPNIYTDQPVVEPWF